MLIIFNDARNFTDFHMENYEHGTVINALTLLLELFFYTEPQSTVIRRQNNQDSTHLAVIFINDGMVISENG